MTTNFLDKVYTTPLIKKKKLNTNLNKNYPHEWSTLLE